MPVNMVKANGKYKLDINAILEGVKFANIFGLAGIDNEKALDLFGERTVDELITFNPTKVDVLGFLGEVKLNALASFVTKNEYVANILGD